MNKYFIEKDLLLGIICKLPDICDNNCNDEVDHDEGAKDNEANQKGHSEDQCQRISFIGILNILDLI